MLIPVREFQRNFSHREIVRMLRDQPEFCTLSVLLVVRVFLYDNYSIYVMVCSASPFHAPYDMFSIHCAL